MTPEHTVTCPLVFDVFKVVIMISCFLVTIVYVY